MSNEKNNNIDVEISCEDQDLICTFSSLNYKSVELEDEIKILKEEMQKLNDSEEECLIAINSDDVKLQIAESIVEASPEEIEEHIDKRKKETQNKLTDLKYELGKIQDEMTKLKAILYAKFGNRNLSILMIIWNVLLSIIWLVSFGICIYLKMQNMGEFSKDEKLSYAFGIACIFFINPLFPFKYTTWQYGFTFINDLFFAISLTLYLISWRIFLKISLHFYQRGSDCCFTNIFIQSLFWHSLYCNLFF